MIFYNSGSDFRRLNHAKIDWKMASKLACLSLATFCLENRAQDAFQTPSRRRQQKIKSLTAKRGGGYAALLRVGAARGPKAPSCVSGCVVSAVEFFVFDIWGVPCGHAELRIWDRARSFGASKQMENQFSELRRPKTRPRRSKTPPRRLQDAPRCAQDAPKTPQEASMTRFCWIWGAKIQPS